MPQQQPAFISAIEQICEEKNIAKAKVIDSIAMALAAAYKKDYGQKGQNIRAKFDAQTGQAKFYQVKLVVTKDMLRPELEFDEFTEEPEDDQEVVPEAAEQKIRFNEERHILLKQAKKKKPKIKAGEEYLISLKPEHDYGRIAAQTAKQVIIQKLREAERETVFEEYKNKEGEVLPGIIQRLEGINIFVDIGKAIGVLFPEEQIPNENYRLGQRLKVFVLRVDKDAKGPAILLSRVHPKLVSQLFRLEVPEIAAGSVEIKSIAREPGSRTKIAVASVEENVDPIGACVGQRGTRVQAVIDELNGEKIDIIQWDKDEKRFIAKALAPGKVERVVIGGTDKVARAIVGEEQLSLVIGKGGQNVRLAARLTGYKLEIESAKPAVKAEPVADKPAAAKKEKAKKSKSKKQDGNHKQKIASSAH